MIKLSICICSRNRQKGLIRLLNSLVSMKIPQEVNVKVLVVENDSENKSEHIVKSYSLISPFEINYFLEINKGLVFARNRSVKEAADSDFCCFIDDDQVADQNWLAELFRCQSEFNCDGVWGCNPPLFSKEVPAYIKQFHSPEMFDYGTIVKTAATNCLLLRKQCLDKIEGPFDKRLNYTGGEDIFLTSQLSELGCIIRYNPEAIAYEVVPVERTKIRYIAQRAFRNSNTAYFVQSLRNVLPPRHEVIIRLIMRMTLGILIIIPFLITKKPNALKGLIKISDALGGFGFILGRHNQFYR